MKPLVFGYCDNSVCVTSLHASPVERMHAHAIIWRKHTRALTDSTSKQGFVILLSAYAHALVDPKAVVGASCCQHCRQH
jgi:hypothetical protein